jgi:nucleoside-diphosphate-sugar epimerase
MNLLFTGASGFIGENILPILTKEYSVTTMGLAAKNYYSVNIAMQIPNLDKRFDLVLHAAGKAHLIAKTEAEKNAFFDVNLHGTKNLCAALEKSGIPRAFIFISTVAVYGLDYGEEVSEDSPLNGTSAYALSKIQAEQFLIEWCKKHDVILSIIRPSLIAGPNPPGSLGSMVKGIKSGQYLSIAGGTARKSVLMVHDIATLVPLLAANGGIYNVCDTIQPTFRDLELLISKQLNKSLPLSIPYVIVKLFAAVGDLIGNKSPINSMKLDKITKSLTFSNKRVRMELGWEPTNVLENFRI